MSTRSLGSLTLDLIAKVGGFTSGMDQAARTAQDRMRKISQVTARATAAIGLSLSGVGVAAVAMAKSFVDSATQIENLSKLAGSNTEVFQRWAAGASTVGISQEKLADILKDTQDKIGDFVQTGGGAMADFFERVAPKVGVTAEQFRKLSGPQALQLYVSSLEKANLSQSDFTFYMEAIASDSTALLPLLRNNGEAMEEYGDQAARLGAIMGGEMLDAARKAREELAELDMVKRGLINRISAELLPSLSNLSNQLTDTAAGAELVDQAAQAAAAGVKILTSAGIALAGTFKTVGEAMAAAANVTRAAFSDGIGAAFQAWKDGTSDIVDNARGTYNSIKGVWENQPPIIFLDPPEAEEAGRQLSAPFKKAEKAAKSARDVIGDEMKAIRRELETFGMTDIELKLFDLKGKGASDEILKEAESILKRVDALKREKDQREELEQAIKAQAEADLQWKSNIEEMLSDLEFEYELLKMTNEQREIAIALRYANVEAMSEEGQMIAEAIKRNQELAQSQADTINAMDSVRNAGADFLVDFTSGAKSFKDSMMDALDSIHQRILQMIAEKLMDRLFGAQGTTGGGGWGQAIGSIFSSVFSGGKASGGAVKPWSMYEVNEYGMEGITVGGRDYLMTGAQGGFVTPANATRYGGGMNQVVNVSIAGRPDARTPEQIARAVGRESQRGMARTGG